MNPIRFLLALFTPRHKALAAQCTTGSGLDVTVEELDRRLGPSDTRTMYETLTRCQQECTRLLLECRKLRSGTITEQVKAFHRAINQPVRERPTMPTEEEARLRLRLVTEEFCEFLEAHGVKSHRAQLMASVRECHLWVNLVEVADACADLDYVIEGTRLCYGIPRQDVADEVHQSNVAKVGGPVVDGKQMKPEGWKPPDVEGVLRRAGWKP